MTRYQYIPATLKHAESLAPRLSQADKDEVWASGHYDALGALRSSVLGSREPFSALVDGRVEVMAGVGVPSFLGGRYQGVPWLLASDEIQKHPREFLRRTQAYIDHQKTEYAILENWVDARHGRAVRWLKWLGFTLEEPKEFGLEKMPFHRFWMKGTVNV